MPKGPDRKTLYDQFNSFTRSLGVAPVPYRKMSRGLPEIQTIYKQHALQIALTEKKSVFHLELKGQYGFEFSLRRQFGASIHDFLVGDSKFDKSFEIKTNNESMFLSIFQNDLRELLLKSLTDQSCMLSLKDNVISFERIGGFQSNSFNEFFLLIVNIAGLIAKRCEDGIGMIRLQHGWAPERLHSSTTSRLKDETYLASLLGFVYEKASPRSDGDFLSYDWFGRHRIQLNYLSTVKPKVLKICIGVTQKFWMRLVVQTGEEHDDEVKIGDPKLDKRFRIHSDHKDSAISFLTSPQIQDVLIQLFPFDRLEIYKGQLALSFLDPLKRRFHRRQYKETITHLINLISIYEEQKIMLAISAITSSANVCPFCREGFHNSEIVVKCKRCQTAHHQTCIAENKQCTTWGCLAKETEFS